MACKRSASSPYAAASIFAVSAEPILDGDYIVLCDFYRRDRFLTPKVSTDYKSVEDHMAVDRPKVTSPH